MEIDEEYSPWIVRHALGFDMHMVVQIVKDSVEDHGARLLVFRALCCTVSV